MFKIQPGVYDTQTFYKDIIKCKKAKAHWKRECMAKLDNAGYEYCFHGYKKIEITKAPETAKERIVDILIRTNIVDKKVLDNELDGYLLFLRGVRQRDLEMTASPWATRQLLIKLYYGIEISDRTLRNWTANLIKKGIMVKSEERINWRTKKTAGIKYQQLVDGDKELEKEREQWISKRNDRLEELQTEYDKLNNTTNVKCPGKWGVAYSELWKEYHTYYFSVAVLELGTDWSEESQAICYELFELIDEYFADRVFTPDLQADSDYELAKQLEELDEQRKEDAKQLNTIEKTLQMLSECTGKNGEFVF